jgi:ABC-type branched-subunit amino acid transport system substrate-binding protein
MDRKIADQRRRKLLGTLAKAGAFASSGALLNGTLISAAAAQVAGADGVSADTIKIGMSAGISGPIAFGSQQFSGFMQRYFEKVNAAGGVNGRKLQLLVLDDGGKGDVALRNAQRFVQEDKVFVVTTIGTPTTAAIIDYLTKQNVPLLFPVAYNTELINPVRANTYALYQSYDGQVAAVTKWGYGKMGKGTAVIVRAVLPSFDSVAASASKAVAAAGGTVTATLNSAYNQPEWSSTVIRLKQLKPDYLILMTTGPDMGRLFKEMIQQNTFPAKATLGISPLGDQAFLDSAGPGIPDNAVFAAIPGTVVQTAPEAKEVRDLWPEQKLGIFGLEGAASGGMMVEAFRRVGRNLTRAALLDLLATKFGPYKLPFTAIAKSSPDHLLIHSIGIATVKNGQFEPATSEFVE